MARKAAVKQVEPATPQEARAFLLALDSLPEGITVGTRGRISNAALAHFTEVTGRPVVQAA